MAQRARWEEMGSGKWEMGNGKWEMGNGKWEMGSWNAGHDNTYSALCVLAKSQADFRLPTSHFALPPSHSRFPTSAFRLRTSK